MKTISNIFVAPSVRQVIFEYIFYPIHFLLLPTNFIYIKSFFITMTEAEFTSP